MSQDFTSTIPTTGTDVFNDNIASRQNENSLRSNFSGTSFPLNPVIGQVCYREDLLKEYQYNGATWVESGSNSVVSNEVIRSRGSLTALDDRLAVSLNDDGTLRSNVTENISEWIISPLVVTYISSSSFSVTNDQTGVFTRNRLVKCELSASYVYASVLTSSFANGVTTVTLDNPVLDSTFQQISYSVLQKQDEKYSDLLGLRKINYNYSVGDIVYPQTYASAKILKCIVGGQSGTSEITIGNIGTTIIDGGVMWAVCSIDGPTASFRNKLINGNFDIWRYGTSQTISGYGSDDRWFNTNAGSTKTHSRQSFAIGQTDVPGNPKFFSRTVVSSVSGASNYCIKAQRIEDVTSLSGKPITLSFWAKADSTKKIAVEFVQFFGTGGSPSATVYGIGVNQLQLTSTWKKFTCRIDIPSIGGKVVGTGADDYLQLSFFFDAGASFNARTNSLGQQSGTFDIAQVQLEEGPVATLFEQRPIGLELALCQRYYEVLGSSGTNTPVLGRYFNMSTVSLDLLVHFAFTPKRSTPSIVASGDKNDGTPTSIEIFSISQNGCTMRFGATASMSYWDVSIITISAEL